MVCNRTAKKFGLRMEFNVLVIIDVPDFVGNM